MLGQAFRCDAYWSDPRIQWMFLRRNIMDVPPAEHLSQRVSRVFFFQSTKTQNTPFPPQKSSKILNPNKRRKSKKQERKRTFPTQKKIFTRVTMTVNRQNRRNEVSLIVGNLAAAIAAEN
jgi:hypothetical protein